MTAYLRAFLSTGRGRLAIGVVIAIAVALVALLLPLPPLIAAIPLYVSVFAVAVPLAIQVVGDAWRRRFGADLLALMAIVTAAVLGEWFVAAIIALMLTSGAALEEAASMRATQVLRALADRTPRVAHVRDREGSHTDTPVENVRVGDVLVILPHEIAPVDGVVLEGLGSMDESYLTGEPYVVPKTEGSMVLSGAVNGPDVLVMRTERIAGESRFAQIVAVLATAEQRRPPIRRLADRLGIAYTIVAVILALVGWWVGGDAERFLAVLVIATPCPLLIGVPVAVIGAISRSAQLGIIIKDPSMLERVSTARTMIFDKTGTLTYGRPVLSTVSLATGFERDEVLAVVSSLESYSRHPLADAVRQAASEVPQRPVERVSEIPGRGLSGIVDGRPVVVTGRRALVGDHPEWEPLLPQESVGLECVVVIDGSYAATLQFRDEPRSGAAEFVGHLSSRHGIATTILISGDRQSEVDYLASKVGLDRAHASVPPEQKWELVRAETARGPTVFLGDGINDAPAMTAATVGIAFGRENEITAEAADAVVLDSSFDRLDELLHIGRRMRRIALQTAIGGIVLSVIGMVLAILGLLPPLAGAIAQEVIDVAAILNATRVALGRRQMADFRVAATTTAAGLPGVQR